MTASSNPTTTIDTWLERFAWTVIAFSCLQILLFGHGRDQGIYAVVGEGLLHSRMPYRDAWDFKPPGIFFVYAFAEALFGKSMASVRLVECAGLLGAVFAFRKIGKELFGGAVPGLLGGALATFLHAELEFWHTGQPESFGGMLTIVAVALTVGPSVRRQATAARRMLAWTLIGVLFGAAFLCKPPLGGGAVVCAAYIAVSEARAARGTARRALSLLTPFLVVGVASVAPIALCGLFFWSQGAWPALSWTLFEFTPGYTKLGWIARTAHGLFLYSLTETLRGFSYLLPTAIVLGLGLPETHPRERGGVWLVVGLFAVHGAGIALQAKFFQYHFGATLPVVSILGGLGLYKSCRLAAKAWIPGVVVWLAGIGGLVWSRDAIRHNPGTFWERTADRMEFFFTRDMTREALDEKLYYVADYDLDVDRKAAQSIASRTEKSDFVFVWGFEPAIYWLSDRRPASRYVYDVPQRTAWGRERARDELMRDLASHPPKIIAVQRNDVFHHVTGDDLDSFAALSTFPALFDLIDEKYRHVETVEDVELFERQ